MTILKTYGPKWLGLSRYFPYPLRAARIGIDIRPFGFWSARFYRNKEVTEAAKADGVVIWYARFAWFQISFSRWV